MFDAKQLIDQYLGAGTLDSLTQQGKTVGQDITARARANPMAATAIAGGLAAVLLGTKSGRKLGGTALKVGGLAAVAGLAYKAYQNHQNGQRPDSNPGQGSDGSGLPLPPADSGFIPDSSEENERAIAMLTAMIQAAKADGYVDADEQARIFDKVDALDLGVEAKAFVMDELRAPLDIDRVTAMATSPEVAMELYAASIIAIDPDHPAEQAYLQMLSARLGLDPALVEHLNATVASVREEGGLHG